MDNSVYTIAARVPHLLLPEDFEGERDWEGLCSCVIEVSGGMVVSISSEIASQQVVETDAADSILLPGFLDAHTHLDKAHSWEEAPNRSGTLEEAFEALPEVKMKWTAEDVYRRADYSLACAHAHGTVAMRTHVDTGLGWAERSYEALSRLRNEWSGRVELQIVSLARLPDYASADGEALADLPVRYGAKALGAMPLMGPDLDQQLDRLIALAAEREVGLDLHVDENDRADADCLAAVARAVLRNEFPYPVVCGHCCNLAVKPLDQQLQTLDLVREASIHVVSLPLCNLYLQDRRVAEDAIQTPFWRGLTLAHEFLERGTVFACASDNVRDVYYAYGDFDMLEVYRESVRIGHLDRKLWQSIGVATSAPAKLMDLWQEGYGRIGVGSPASFNIFHVSSLNQLLSRTQVKRSLFRNDRFISPELPPYLEIGEG